MASERAEEAPGSVVYWACAGFCVERVNGANLLDSDFS